MVAENIARVRQQMEAAARRAGRPADAVALMAVTKTVSVAGIRQAYAAGIRLFGENRVQEFAAKQAELADLNEASFHLIGHLQSNKAAMAAGLFAGVDSVDSPALARKLNAAALRLQKKLPVLLEINIGGEAAKAGFAPKASELEALLRAAPELGQLSIQGLMAVPPYCDNAEASRPYFRRMRELRDQLEAQRFPQVSMGELSLGMSHDFEIAIEEGATSVRVGTAIFGERQKL